MPSRLPDLPLPGRRPRRLRRTETLRRMVRETELSPADFIYPLFVTHESNTRREIGAMPGNYHWSVDRLAGECEEIATLGIPSVILFGIPEEKDPVGRGAYDPNGVVQQAVREIKRAVPQLVVMTDVCLCEYTDHGHCGVIHEDQVLNDPTLQLLAATAVSHAEAGADIIAPSDMMDGRIAALRHALDGAGFLDTPLLSYAAKYASGFYGPFREAAGSTPQFGDRRSYQMDPANRREALKEVLLDLEEGADMIMVKPALSYLDIIREVKDATQVPVAAYNVSGEYSMVRAAAQLGWIDGDRVMMEILTSIKRAGADLILTYHAKEAARLLRDG
jgi:porphobilinogen synthase